MTKKLSAVDLFSGAGGLSLGFKNADIEVLVANDKSESAAKTYRHNFPETPFLKEDITKIDAEDLMEKGDFSKDDVDLIIGGPPCKGFSLGGRRDPDDPRNQLFKEYLKVVEALEPRAVIMENVTGLLSMKDGEFKEKIKDGLKGKGYKVEGMPRTLNAADFGVPQKRRRIIFAGIHESEELEPEDLEFPERAEEDYIGVKEAIHDLAFLGVGERAESYENPPETPYQEKMREKANRLHNHKSPNHGNHVRTRFEKMDPGRGMETVPEKYRTKKHSVEKFHPKEPSNTVTTLPEDFVHYSKPRIPTVREMARIQSFPDHFEFKGPATTGGGRRKDSVPQYSQVGNAVPPLMAESIAEEVKRHLV